MGSARPFTQFTYWCVYTEHTDAPLCLQGIVGWMGVNDDLRNLHCLLKEALQFIYSAASSTKNLTFPRLLCSDAVWSCRVKMEIASSSEMLISYHTTTQCHNPQHRDLNCAWNFTTCTWNIRLFPVFVRLSYSEIRFSLCFASSCYVIIIV